MHTKRLVVVGSTGAQGGSVISAVLSDPSLNQAWKLCGITRTTDSQIALDLKERGVEIVEADLNDVMSLKRAFSGAEAVFGVTNFWEKTSKEVEVQQGKNIADACKESGSYLIWSSLPSISKLSKGEITTVHHFDSKAEVENYIRERSIPAAFVWASWYMENQPTAMFRLDPEVGHYVFTLPCPPETKLPVLDCFTDFGKFVAPILHEPEKLQNRRVLAASQYISLQDMVRIYNESKPRSWKDAVYKVKSIDAEVIAIARKGSTEPSTLSTNFQMLSKVGYFGGECLEPSLALVKQSLRDWRQFVQDTDHPAWKHFP